MNPDALVPFAYELIWYSLGGLTVYIGVQTHFAFGLILLLGGIIGGIARNYNPDWRSSHE